MLYRGGGFEKITVKVTQWRLKNTTSDGNYILGYLYLRFDATLRVWLWGEGRRPVRAVHNALISSISVPERRKASSAMDKDPQFHNKISYTTQRLSHSLLISSKWKVSKIYNVGISEDRGCSDAICQDWKDRRWYDRPWYLQFSETRSFSIQIVYRIEELPYGEIENQ